MLIVVCALFAAESQALNQLFGGAKAKTLAVCGANGKTGRKAVTLALKKGKTVKAITTGGVFNTEGLNISDSKNLINIAGNVQDQEGLMTSLKGCDAAIFTASASKTGGTPQQVDRDGLVNVAKACIANNVPRLGMSIVPWCISIHILLFMLSSYGHVAYRCFLISFLHLIMYMNPYSLNKIVVVSSGAVTKPFSPVYLFLNLFGGIMKAKVEGEQEVAR